MLRTVILSIVLLLGLDLQGHAQEPISKSLTWKKGQEVSVELPFGDSIEVKTWTKAEVKVDARVNINGGTNNDAFTMEAESKGVALFIRSGVDEKKLKSWKEGPCENMTVFDGKHVSLRISYVVYLPEKARFKLETISADVNLAAGVGDANIRSISGAIDLQWKENEPAYFHFKTITGEVFTDLEALHYPQGFKQGRVGLDLDASIQQGGPQIKLETVSSNIYLRRYP